MASEAPPPPGLFREARPKPLGARSPRRSRKLMPRVVTAAPAERSELMAVGVGTGVGDGVGLAARVGVGEGVWACAEDDAAALARMRTKTMAMAVARPPPILVFLAREKRDAQHINDIP